MSKRIEKEVFGKKDGEVEVRPQYGGFFTHHDSRGSWTRTMESHLFPPPNLVVAQSSVSITQKAKTMRGLHALQESAQEWKLVTCVRGEVWDVVVDVRAGFESFGSYTERHFDGRKASWVLIPPGFAHGFISLTDDVVMSYVMTAHYDAALELGYRYDDPKFEIRWPEKPRLISDRDKSFQYL